MNATDKDENEVPFEPKTDAERFLEAMRGDLLTADEKRELVRSWASPVNETNQIPDDRLIDLFLQDERPLEERVRIPFPKKSSSS